MFRSLIQASILAGIGIYSLSILLSKNKLQSLKHTKKLRLNVHTREISIERKTYEQVVKEGGLSEYVKKSIPIIITDIPPNFFTTLHKNYPINSIKTDKLHITSNIFPKIGNRLSTFISNNVGLPVFFMTTFIGSYKSGFAHMDSVSSYNFYYVKNGSKDVYIVPHEYTCYLDMKNGSDNVYVGEDNEGTDKLKIWLDKVPGYYHFNVNKGEVLLFNNSKCIHKFINVTGKEEIYSIRMLSNDSSPLILKNDLFNFKQAEQFVDNIVSGGKGVLRNTKDV